MFDFIKNMIMPSKYEIKKAKNDEFYFILKAPNGRVILTSELYKNIQNTINGINSVKKNSEFVKNFEIRTSSDGQFYFVLKATNNKIVGISETYTTHQNASKGINSVVKFGNTDKIIK